MKQLLYRALIILLLIITSSFGNKNPKEKITADLVDKGFENIIVKIDSVKLFLAYENRVYRFNVESLKQVMNVISNYTELKMIKIIVLQNQVPLVIVEYNNDDYINYLEHKLSRDSFIEKLIISYDTDEMWTKEKNSTVTNNSNYKFDLVLNPNFKGQFGDYSNVVRAQVNFIPEIKTSWWKGMEITAQTIIPLYNEFPGEGNYLRPGIISLHQTFRLPDCLFITSSLGYFTENRYGIDFTFRKIFYEGNISLGFNAGYTGYMSIFNKKIFYSEPYLWTANLSMEYRINKYDLTLGITAGKFLYNDESIRFDANRQFGEVEIGFFAVRSLSGETNGGFNFSIPLFPSSYWNPSVVRIRTSDSFRWEYRVRGEIPSMIGVIYNTGNTFIRSIKKFNPNFILNELKNN